MSKEKLSRRDFLLGAGGILATGLKPETAHAEGDARRQGIAQLKNSAERDPGETNWFLVTDNNGSHWEQPQSFEAIGEIMDRGGSYLRVEMTHTHPRRMTRRECVPPGFMDILTLFSFKTALGNNKGGRFTGMVVDCYGTWSYDLDLSNAFMGKLEVGILKMRMFFSKISPQILDEVTRFARQQNVSANLAIGFMLAQNQNRLSPSLFAATAEIREYFGEILSSDKMRTLLSTTENAYKTVDLTDHGERERVMDICRRSGIILRFIPHSTMLAAAQ